jgi:hypothetical protein
VNEAGENAITRKNRWKGFDANYRELTRIERMSFILQPFGFSLNECGEK